MDEIFSKLFIWLRVPLTLLLTIFLVRLFYYFYIKKEREKIRAVRTSMEQQETWSSPLFYNTGFCVGLGFLLLGFVMILMGAHKTDANYVWVETGIVLFGLWFLWFTPAIRLRKESIEFQPLPLKLLHLNLFKTTLPYGEIQKVTKESTMPPFIQLTIHTKDSRRLKLNTAAFNSEIGNALYAFLQKKFQG